jgi:hypothetical protein
MHASARALAQPQPLVPRKQLSPSRFDFTDSRDAVWTQVPAVDLFAGQMDKAWC